MDKPHTLRELFEDRFAPIKLRGRKQDTFRLYRSTVKLFGDFLARDATVEDLNDLTVARFLIWYESRPSVKSAKSVNNRRQHIQTLWEFAARKGWTPTFPDIQRLPEPEITPKAWTLDELQQLFRTIDTEEILPIGRQPGHVYWRTIHLWFWYTGERSGASLKVTWEMIDLEARKARVPAEIRKGGVKPKAYDLPDSLCNMLALMRQIDPSAKLVFGEFKFHQSTWYNRYSALLKLAGLPDNRLSKAHRMRKTHATQLHNAGGDAQKSLGHSRAETTQRYLDPEQTSREVPAWQLLPEINS